LGGSEASGAQEPASPAEIDPEAKAALHRMASFLANAKRLSVTLDITYDVVQVDGQKIEFGDRRKVALRRPDRFRADSEERDGTRRGVLFDGGAIYAFDLDENVYASVPKQGTTDEALDYAVGELGMRVPLAELFSSDLPRRVDRASRVQYVAEERIEGVPCDHVAARTEEVDYEVWIANGERPLPQRIVITYRQAEGQPQFAASFSSWNLSPDLPDALFAFKPAEDAEWIRVSPAPEGARP
jgi:hypothetical protein